MENIGLLEYAAKHPAQEPPQERQAIETTARTYREQQEAQDTAAALKESIAQQIKQGNEPQYILYAALKAIGLLTNDPEWAEAQQRRLDTVYADLAQQSLFMNNAAIAAERLEKMQGDYIDRMRRQLTKSLSGYRRIEKALTEALQAVNEAESVKDPGILEK